MKDGRRNRRRAGFTLVEVMVAVVLMILLQTHQRKVDRTIILLQIVAILLITIV